MIAFKVGSGRKLTKLTNTQHPWVLSQLSEAAALDRQLSTICRAGLERLQAEAGLRAWGRRQWQVEKPCNLEPAETCRRHYVSTSRSSMS